MSRCTYQDASGNVCGFPARHRYGGYPFCETHLPRGNNLRFATTLIERRKSASEAEEHIAKLRMPLLHYFGTTDPELLAEVWKEQARVADARKEDGA